MSLRDFLRFIVLACIFATPFICLIVAENMFFPFITGKNFTFRILTEVMLGAWVTLMFVDATYRPKFSWVLAAVGAFIVAITIADFHGVNPYRSFWSNYERMEGLITHLHLFLYFVIAGSVIATEELWNWFWRTSLGVSVIVAIYAFSQLSGKEAIHQSSTRLDATFGNSAYLAVYALFNIFLAGFLYLRSDRKSGMQWVYPIIAVLNFIVLFYTQTRGTLLGLVGGSFLAMVLVAILGKEHPRLKRYSRFAIVAVVVAVGLFISFRNSTFIQNSPTLQRMASISIGDSTTNSRFMIWNMSWQGFKEHPILGWGQENFLYVFSKSYVSFNVCGTALCGVVQEESSFYCCGKKYLYWNARRIFYSQHICV
jgi:O-antigen ligase